MRKRDDFTIDEKKEYIYDSLQQLKKFLNGILALYWETCCYPEMRKQGLSVLSTNKCMHILNPFTTESINVRGFCFYYDPEYDNIGVRARKCGTNTVQFMQRSNSMAFRELWKFVMTEEDKKEQAESYMEAIREYDERGRLFLFNPIHYRFSEEDRFDFQAQECFCMYKLTEVAIDKDYSVVARMKQYMCDNSDIKGEVNEIECYVYEPSTLLWNLQHPEATEASIKAMKEYIQYRMSQVVNAKKELMIFISDE